MMIFTGPKLTNLLTFLLFTGFDSVEDLSMSSCASSHHSGDPALL